MSARGPAIIRNINRFDVLQTIRLYDNQISRSESSELTGLSQATISSIVGHLIGEGDGANKQGVKILLKP
jgi:hypothetical protein